MPNILLISRIFGRLRATSKTIFKILSLLSFSFDLTKEVLTFLKERLREYSKAIRDLEKTDNSFFSNLDQQLLHRYR